MDEKIDAINAAIRKAFPGADFTVVISYGGADGMLFTSSQERDEMLSTMRLFMTMHKHDGARSQPAPA